MKTHHICILFSLLMLGNPAAKANNEDTWADISDVGAYGVIATALLLPGTRKDWTGLRQAAYSIGTATVTAQIGKALIDEERPDNSDDDSFPSGHTANAFASATTLHRRYGRKNGFPAKAVATYNGVARERARKHHWYDVLAGAVIGGASGWFFTDAFDSKVQMVPWVDSKGGGVALSMRW
jgi:membrane-associated phospholipid phosphatase